MAGKKAKLGADEAAVLVQAGKEIRSEHLKKPEVFKNLLVWGFIDKRGHLTKKGLTVQKKLWEKEAALMKGVPVSDRKGNPKAVHKYGPWYRIRKGNLDITTSVNMLFVGKPRAGMELGKLPTGVHNKLRSFFVNKAKECSKVVTPSLCRIPFVGGPKLIDLVNKESGKKVASVQAMFYDFVAFDKRKKLRFCAEGPESPVVVWGISNKGEDRVVAIILPFVEV